ncbi:hypothetical protein BDP27DRAFT_1431206 [Rhodocollybia butyracea]|uniref:Peptide hydrolase n=1 Tax=Rhodocollybia butyracea TaxID=206335 RepID=A0A9P5PAF0_9AGAR|nr:hypothetical protein BDP27DRAFT_1431206 [Rhodocollybia butyracea]
MIVPIIVLLAFQAYGSKIVVEAETQASFLTPDNWNEDVSAVNWDSSALRLVRFFTDETEDGLSDPKWVTNQGKLDAKRDGNDFIDITENPDFDLYASTTASFQAQHVYHPPNSTFVTRVIPLLRSEEQKANLETFTSFYTRFYDSDTGHASSRWLYNRILNYTDEYASSDLKASVHIELVLYEHTFKQESVIIRLLPNNVSSSKFITIIGAHCDSLNIKYAGTVTILEAYRAILDSGYVPKSPLEFHFYAAEEGGLLGSLDIVSSYVKAGKDVRGMMQFDMTAWVAAGTEETIGLVMDRVYLPLTEWQKSLVEAYLDISWTETMYDPRAGSDHHAWIYAGYPATTSIEGRWEDANEPNAHTPNDAIDISQEFSFDHILQFTKLAVAFAVELSDY